MVVCVWESGEVKAVRQIGEMPTKPLIVVMLMVKKPGNSLTDARREEKTGQ